MGKKKLYESDPRKLRFHTLGKLQSALIGKLVLVNMELKARLREAAPGTPSFYLSADQLEGFNLILDHLLVSAEGKSSPVA